MFLRWKPWFPQGRLQGHPHTRWSDDIAKIAGGDWYEKAQNRVLWKRLEHAFVNRDDVLERLSSGMLAA
eukprot:5739999-Karenia_brevis.AAC.1